MPGLDRDGVQQALAIGRATVAGYLQSDLMPPGMQAPALIWAAAFFVGPALFLPLQFFQKYSFLRRYLPARVPDALVADRLVFLVLSSCAIGLIAVVLWETLFPSRRDAFVLGPLPVSPAVQVTGRLLGLGALFGAFVAALNVVPAVLFPFVSAPGLTSVPQWAAAHTVASVCANAFVFFSITALQGMALLLGGPRLSAKLGAIAQGAAALLVLFAILFLGAFQGAVLAALHDPAAHAVELAWFPAAWFSGLYEAMAGGSPVPAGVFLRGLLAAVVPLLLTVALYVFGYGRFMARAMESRGRHRPSMTARALAGVLGVTIIRRPEDQAVAGFVVRVLARSSRHRMLVSAAVGCALAVIAAGILPDLLRNGINGFKVPTGSVLAAPLVFSAALAVSVRLVMTVPVDLPARWVLQLAPLAPRRVDAATHRAFLLLVVPTVGLLAIASAWPLWGYAVALQHAAFCGALALLLCEALLFGFRGFPYARPYVPGGAHVHLLWPAYLALFATYTYGMAAVERLGLAQETVWPTAGVIAGFAIVLWALRWWKRRADTEVNFEAELPDTTFAGFNLTEVYAAERVATPRARYPE